MDRWVTATLVLTVLQLLTLSFGVTGARKFPSAEPLPPCSSTPGGIPGWDCYDAPTEPLPPCDFKHQRAGFDCWPNTPPTAKPDAKLDQNTSLGDGVGGDAPGSPSKGHSAHTQQRGGDTGGDSPGSPSKGHSSHTQQRGQDPSLGGDTGGDAPGSPSKGHSAHTQQRGGDTGGDAPGSPSKGHHEIPTQSAHTQQWQEPLPPCSSTPGGIPGWDCYDPPTEPLPPCDFNHQRAGFDCWPSSPKRT